MVLCFWFVGGQLVALSGLASSPEAGVKMIEGVLKDGTALKKFEEMIVCQGVEPEIARKLCHGDTHAVLGTARHETEIPAKGSGKLHYLFF